jgi:hypothetical protein
MLAALSLLIVYLDLSNLYEHNTYVCARKRI